MKTEQFHREDFYEDYILGKHTEQEETAFEEHLLHCNHCQQELELFEKIISETRKQTRQFDFKKRQTFRISIPLGIAASILLLAGLMLLFFRNSPKNNPTQIFEQNTAEQPAIEDSLREIRIERKVETTEKDAGKLAQNTNVYKPHPAFENSIRNYTRSGSIEVFSPKSGQKFLSSDTVLFAWRNSPEKLYLAIFDNTGKLLFEKQVSPPYAYTATKGLYYFQIENSEESLFTGKFIIK